MNPSETFVEERAKLEGLAREDVECQTHLPFLLVFLFLLHPQKTIPSREVIRTFRLH